MAVTAVPLRAFARLKLRILGNGLRGQGWRIALFVLGILAGVWLAGTGFLLFLSTVAGDQFARLVPAFGGTTLVLGWLFLPLVWAGVDETLDPARFALLPIPRRRLILGLLVGALLGVPTIATFLATLGLVVAAGVRGGGAGALLQTLGAALGVLLCVALSRAVTSAFANVLRARRTRDLAAVVLALLAASLGPLQIGLLTALQSAKYDQMARVADVLGWTPFGAPFVVGTDVAAGRWWAIPIRLAIAVGTVAALLWWWSVTVETAMVGTVSSARVRALRGPSGGLVPGLYPRLLRRLPRTRFGAIVAREVRYWWRDARRRASLFTMAVVSVFVPAMLGVTLAGDPPTLFVTTTMLSVGSLAAVNIANQFGFDGTAYATQLVTGVRGRTELSARALAFSVIMVPLLCLVAVLFAAIVTGFAVLPVILGALFAAYGTGLAVNGIISVLAAYAQPETQNPFAMNTGAGAAKSLLTFVSLVGVVILTQPVALVAAFVDSSLAWLVLPVGTAYGLGAAALGVHIGGNLLDGRGPELLVAVTPKR